MYKMHRYSEDKMLYLTSTKCLPSVLSLLPVSLVAMVWQYMYMRAPTLQCKHSSSSFPRREWAWVDRARGREMEKERDKGGKRKEEEEEVDMLDFEMNTCKIFLRLTITSW